MSRKITAPKMNTPAPKQRRARNARIKDPFFAVIDSLVDSCASFATCGSSAILKPYCSLLFDITYASFLCLGWSCYLKDSRGLFANLHCERYAHGAHQKFWQIFGHYTPKIIISLCIPDVKEHSRLSKRYFCSSVWFYLPKKLYLENYWSHVHQMKGTWFLSARGNLSVRYAAD